MQIRLVQRIAQQSQHRADIFRRSVCGGAATHPVSFLPHLFLVHNAGHSNLSPARRGYRFQIQQRPLILAVHRQSMHHADSAVQLCFLLGMHGVMTALDHPFHIIGKDHRSTVHLRQPGAHLHDVHRIAATGGVAPDRFRFLPGHRISGAFGGSGGNLPNLLRCQCAEKHLHAPGAQRRTDFRRAACRRADQAEICRKAVTENVVNVARNAGVVRVIIGTVQHHAAIFQHFEQLIHLHGVQFANLVQKKHAAVCTRHRPWFGLRHALRAELTGALINRVVNAADERIGNGALVKADAGGIHLDERRIHRKRRAVGLFRRLQYQPRRARFSHAGRAVNQHMLRIGTAQNRFQAANAVLLPDHVLHRRRPHALRQRF